jgi:hypothetical protein
LVSSGLIIAGFSVLKEWNTDSRVLLGGNELFFGLTTISYFLHIKSLRSRILMSSLGIVYSSLIGQDDGLYVAVHYCMAEADRGR